MTCSTTFKLCPEMSVEVLGGVGIVALTRNQNWVCQACIVTVRFSWLLQVLGTAIAHLLCFAWDQ